MRFVLTVYYGLAILFPVFAVILPTAERFPNSDTSSVFRHVSTVGLAYCSPGIALASICASPINPPPPNFTESRKAEIGQLLKEADRGFFDPSPPEFTQNRSTEMKEFRMEKDKYFFVGQTLSLLFCLLLCWPLVFTISSQAWATHSRLRKLILGYSGVHILSVLVSLVLIYQNWANLFD